MPLRRVWMFALSLIVAAAAEPGATAGQPLAYPPSASPAQPPPVNPIAISFEASLDHDATDAKGPKVVKYVIEFVPVFSEGERKELDLGKPKPVDGLIVVPLKKVALKPGRYAVSVRAFGRTAESSMSWVGPFDIVDPNAPKSTAPAGHDHHGHGAPAAAPPASTPPPSPPNPPPPTSPPAPASSAPNTVKPESGKPDKPAEAKPAEAKDEGKQKRGFWRKFYDKIVGSP